jgi:hypothetical protein
MLSVVASSYQHPGRRRSRRLGLVTALLLAAGLATAPAQEAPRDARMDEPGRRILTGIEWSALLPALGIADELSTAWVPAFTVGYADVLVEGLHTHLGLGYWYLTGEDGAGVGVHAFPAYLELEYAPFRGVWAEAGLSVQSGAVRTDIRKRGRDEWEKREEGLAWYGYGAAGPVFTLKLGSFVRLQTGARWIMLIQPQGITGFVGIPLGVRVRL